MSWSTHPKHRSGSNIIVDQFPTSGSICELNALITDVDFDTAEAVTHIPFQPSSPPLTTTKMRANIANPNDIPLSQSPPAASLITRRQPQPGSIEGDSPLSANPSEANMTTSEQPQAGAVITKKAKKGVFGFISKVFNTNKRPKISIAYDPIHLTHVSFDSSTGKFTGLPKEWQQFIQESSISRQQREKNPQATMEIVKLHHKGLVNDVWDKQGALGPTPSSLIKDAESSDPQKPAGALFSAQR
ncbi:hypothetical protein AX15_000573 [Amanita polypyramis BW_CC]|nr:hypothetical protein AX15_000573 [Amanita polypyramis BW_CC]